jgi:DNA modification methylase
MVERKAWPRQHGMQTGRKIPARQAMNRPPLQIQATTLWEYPSQHYGSGRQGSKDYEGATPSYIIWNLLMRYTKPGDLVVDPMCGSGTTLDVARDLERRALGFDLQPTRTEIRDCDARHLPLENASADFVFLDPPYSTHILYSGRPECLGNWGGNEPGYYQGMGEVIGEMQRILKPGALLGLYICDSFAKGKPFMPLGFRIFSLLQERFEAIDIVAVVRHNADLRKGNYRKAAQEGNFFLRGFNYLFIMRKPIAPEDREAETFRLKPQWPTQDAGIRDRAPASAGRGERRRRSDPPQRGQGSTSLPKRGPARDRPAEAARKTGKSFKGLSVREFGMSLRKKKKKP